MNRYVGLDFETFGAVDLRKHGLDRYIKHHSFQALLAAIVEPDGTKTRYDFVREGADAQAALLDRLYFLTRSQRYTIVAHNAGFERAVLDWMGAESSWYYQIVDSAVIARSQGAASSLEGASAQLTNAPKLAIGSELIRLFSIPNEWNGGEAPTPELVNEKLAEWEDFGYYCEVDADGSRLIAERFPAGRSHSTHIETQYEQLTARMNDTGWRVDLDLVREMQLRYEDNVARAIANFRQRYDPDGALNLASSMQLKKWCEERGIRATSFDADHVEQLLTKVQAKLVTMQPSDPKRDAYHEVEMMLHTKKVLGGSSLKKLQTILDTTGPDGRLRHQYIHVGAGQTYRTSGRSVQMQNLKRLGADPLDMDEVFQVETELDNDMLAENLRQVFTSSDPNGELIVGDFSSVESRGLAWLAGADWKVDAYRQGKDLYKVQAASIYGVRYEDVTKAQRQTGKIGELSCGYGAGPAAVKRFAHGYGVEFTDEEALQLVRDWRAANPEIVDLWDRIDTALHRAAAGLSPVPVSLGNGLGLLFHHADTPDSLLKQHPGAQSIRMLLLHPGTGLRVLERLFHGCYVRGRNVCYYKPAERKTGPLWNSHFTDPKTKAVRFYDVYGGKLAGILTQSFCRELFFQSLSNLNEALRGIDNATIVGQFHDEIVVDYVPGATDVETVRNLMQESMTSTPRAFSKFPLEADIKSSYRYIK